jgi:hypothetical protein
MKKQYRYKRKYVGMTVEQVRNDIRWDWMSYSVKFAAIQARAERIQLENGRFKTFIRCCGCSGLFLRSEIQAHHINPVGRLESTSREDVEAYMARMFVKKAEIQPLCKPCHDKIPERDKYHDQNQEDPNDQQPLQTNHTPPSGMGRQVDSTNQATYP